MNTAIIVAAGSGTRFGSETPKQFLEIFGKPVLSHTLASFESSKLIDEVVLVAADRDRDSAEEMLKRFPSAKVRGIVTGGKLRVESVRNGFTAIGHHSGVVAVHDGARPLVTADEIDAVVKRASEAGAACLTAPVTDTIKQISGHNITGTLDRTTLRRALTPQAFRYEILREALSANYLNTLATDECFLVEKLGQRIEFVDGSPHNIKITYPEDIIFAEAILKGRN